MEKARIRSVMLVGGSRIAVHLTKLLCDAGIQVKILENDQNKCEQLSVILPEEALLCNSDGTSFQTLLNEGLEEVGALVTLTNIDEQNLVISMYASHMQVPKVITKINRLDYDNFVHDSEVESTVSPRMLVCNNILRYVRSMQNRQGNSMLALHRMLGGRVEALEFRVTHDTWYIGKSLIDAPIQKGILVAAISRRGQVIIPSGLDCLKENDSVVIVTGSGHALKDLNDIFSEPSRE